MIPRSDLPQIPKDQVRHFIEYCQHNGVFSEAVKIYCKDLKPIQQHVKREKVEKFKKQFEKDGITAKDTILVSQDGYILDGHHRWLAAKELNPLIQYPCIRFKCKITELVKLGHKFDGSFVQSVTETTTYKQLVESLWNIS